MDRLAHLRLWALLVALFSGAAACSSTADPPDSELVVRADWGERFEDAGVTGTFALREVGATDTSVWNSERAATQRLPASTFKILNSLIIMETGVLPDVDTAVQWDGIERAVPAWNRDHSLRSGIEVSAVWAYQELARQVGLEPMQRWVDRTNYGNREIGGGIDEFWLRGDLRISPLEQLDFLESLATRELPFRRDVQDSVADILVREQGSDWAWSHKTGTALSEDPVLGWLVGIVESDGRTYVFAMNLDLSSPDLSTQIDPRVRQELTRRILEHEGILPP